MGEGKELVLFSLIGVAGREELRQDNGSSELKSLETVLFSGLLIKMFDMMWWNEFENESMGGWILKTWLFLCVSPSNFILFGVVLTLTFP
jgi:hypothetical protein